MSHQSGITKLMDEMDLVLTRKPPLQEYCLTPLSLKQGHQSGVTKMGSPKWVTKLGHQSGSPK